MKFRLIDWINNQKTQSIITLISLIVAVIAFFDARQSSKESKELSKRTDSLEFTLNSRIVNQILLFQKSSDSISSQQLKVMKQSSHRELKNILANIVVSKKTFEIVPKSFGKYYLDFFIELNNIGKRNAIDVKILCFLINNDATSYKLEKDISLGRIDPEIIKNQKIRFDIGEFSLDKFYVIFNLKYFSDDDDFLYRNEWFYWETNNTLFIDLKSISERDLNVLIDKNKFLR